MPVGPLLPLSVVGGAAPAFEDDQRSYLTVAIGCTGGQHRSVYLVETLAAALRPMFDKLVVRHRELRNLAHDAP